MTGISFKGSMPEPLYAHGPIIMDRREGHIIRRTWQPAMEAWEYTIDFPAAAAWKGAYGLMYIEADLIDKIIILQCTNVK